MICWRHTYKGGNWKPSDKSGVYVFSFTASFNTPTCCESRGWKFTSTKQVGHLGFISSPGVVFLDVSRNHWWLGWVMIHHATIMPPPLDELKKPVRKFWWNKFKQHSREVWCNWPGKHPWREFLGKKCQLLRWVGKIEPHHIAWDLTYDLGLEILSPLRVWSRDPNWRHYLWAKPWLRGTGLSLSSLCLEWTELWDRIVGAKGIRYKVMAGWKTL